MFWLFDLLLVIVGKGVLFICVFEVVVVYVVMCVYRLFEVMLWLIDLSMVVFLLIL